MEEGRAVTSLAQVAGTGRARDAAASRRVVDLGGVAGRSNDDGLMRSRGGRKGWTDSDEYRGGCLDIAGEVTQAEQMSRGIGPDFHEPMPRPSKQWN